VGVGNNPHSLALMWGTEIGRAQHTPSRIIPEDGKILEDGDKSASAKVRGIFDERPLRLDLADDAGELCPQSRACAGESSALTRC
jgi:hypothetical protein